MVITFKIQKLYMGLYIYIINNRWSIFASRDCLLFMPKGGPVFRVGGGVKFLKSMKKRECFFKIQIRG